VGNEFQLFLCLSKSFLARSAVKSFARYALTEVRVRLCKLRRDNTILILAEVQDKNRSCARCAQAEKSLRVRKLRELLERLLLQRVHRVEEFNTWKYSRISARSVCRSLLKDSSHGEISGGLVP
jgi:hypothetical protein